MSKFITKRDKEKRSILKKQGLQEVSKDYGTYVFLNQPERLATFNKNELKISYTNKICI